jgi:hypothetical protein
MLIYFLAVFNLFTYTLVLLLSIGIQILSKEFERVLGPGQIVTSLEHLGTVPGIQA